MDGTLRNIQPHPQSTFDEPDDLPESSVHLPKKRRISARIACDPCRRKKGACDGVKPICGRCGSKKLECVYQKSMVEANRAFKGELAGLQQAVSVYRELLDHIKTLPEMEALDLVRKMKSDSDPALLLSSLRGSMHGRIRLSEYKAARATAIPKRTAIEFELTVRHRLAYPDLLVLDTALISLDPLLQLSDNICDVPGRILGQRSSRLDSTLPIQGRSMTVGSSSAESSFEPHSFDIEVMELETGVIDPAPFSKSNMRKLNMSKWTKVPITKDLACKIIVSYMKTDHYVWGFFEAKLFLKDLVDGKERFCSSLLVNALLFYAAQHYITIDPRCAALSRAFYREAKNIWSQRESDISLTTLSAIPLLSLGCQIQELEDGEYFLHAGYRLALETALFVDEEPGLIARGSETIDAKIWKRAKSHVAWGTFNWTVLNSFYYRLEAPLTIPAFPIPGLSVAGKHASDTSMSEDAHAAFAATCQLNIILCEVSRVYLNPRDETILGRVSIKFAERKFRELLDWSDSLPLHLARNYDSPIYVLILHITIHSSVLEIFRPFTGHGTREGDSTRLESFTSADSSPENIFAASEDQLRRLLVTVHLEYPKSDWSCALNLAILQLGNATLRYRRGSDWRFYYLLCLCMCIELYESYPVFLTIVKGSLSMAMRERLITSSESRLLLERIQGRYVHYEPAVNGAATFIIDYDLATTEPEAARGQDLAQRFDELAIFSDFTTGTLEASDDEVT